MNIPRANNLSPLWVISLFVTFTETVLGYALTKTTEWVQGSLTVFVIVFAVGVASAFFYILWHKPSNFYSPADFGKMSPKEFVEALQGTPSATIQQAQRLANNPSDTSALFQLLDGILDNIFKQHLILMADQNALVPLVTLFGHRYEYGTRRKRWGNGMFQGGDFARKLEGTGFVEIVQNQGPKFQITDQGRAFAKWLVDQGQKDEFFTSELGGWGTPFKPTDDKV